jgi:hypothetical protein
MAAQDAAAPHQHGDHPIITIERTARADRRIDGSVLRREGPPVSRQRKRTRTGVARQLLATPNFRTPRSTDAES